MDNNLTFLNACRNGQKSIAQIFLKKGGIDVNKRDAEGNTPLYYACLKGYRDLVLLLLDSGADVSVTNNRSETPLHAAARSGNKEIIEKLVAKGADLNTTDADGRTPLLCLLDNRRTDAALFLIGRGADTEIADSDGHKAIDYATANGLREVVSRLSAENTSDVSGNTPLHQAVYNGQSEIVRTLLASSKAMLDATNDNGETPLIMACMNGNLMVATLLLNAGADGQGFAERERPIALCRLIGKQVSRRSVTESESQPGRAEQQWRDAADCCVKTGAQRVCRPADGTSCRCQYRGQPPTHGLVLRR